MSISLDNEPLEIICPTCKKKITKPISWFKKQGQVCPFGCGTSLDTEEFRKGIEKAEKDLREFFQSLKRL
jgi:hypothetical protein